MSTASKYRVSPFSGARYHENSAKCDDASSPCAICGKPVKHVDAKHHAIVINGGAAWGDESSPQDGGHMGGWPVGPDCHRRYVVTEATAKNGKAVKP